MNVVLIEDELNQLDVLSGLVKELFPDINIVCTATSVSSGLSAIKQYQPDLIITDVVIQGGTSFDLLEQLENLDSEVIFTTSYEKYAIQAFKISAIDYLLKPIDREELKDAIEKARKRIDLEDTSSHLRLLLANVHSENDQVKVALPTMKGYSFVNADEILRCESDNTYTTFFLIDGREILVSKTLKSCEQMLEQFSFCRVHNSSLVNLKHIVEYMRGEGGVVKMKDDSEVAVSRRRKDQFLELFKKQVTS